MVPESPHVRYDATAFEVLSVLEPVAELPSSARHRRATATELLESVPDETVLAVAPQNTATGYRLANEPLTAVDLEELPAGRRVAVSAAATEDLADYRVLVWGRAEDHGTHTLLEYA
jgi:hypothetical protein